MKHVMKIGFPYFFPVSYITMTLNKFRQFQKFRVHIHTYTQRFLQKKDRIQTAALCDLKQVLNLRHNDYEKVLTIS